jgi:hypothetical protein
MTAQVARKTVAEKSARRVRGAMGLGDLKKVETALKYALGETSYLGRSIASWGEPRLRSKEGFACSGRGS